MAKYDCDHCGKRRSKGMCKGCGYRVCKKCIKRFEYKSALMGYKRRCPNCGKYAGWTGF